MEFSNEYCKCGKQLLIGEKKCERCTRLLKEKLEKIGYICAGVLVCVILSVLLSALLS